MSKIELKGTLDHYGYGYSANVDGKTLEIWYAAPREGGVVYRGLFKGLETPYIKDIKKSNPMLYNSIWDYFKNYEEEDNPPRYSKMIMFRMRTILEVDENDTSKDGIINEMEPRDVFDMILKSHHPDTRRYVLIKTLIREIFGVDLEARL